MGDEEKCSNSSSSGGSRSYKKMKQQKKVPQRGLGVAQLEKIRLEEQLKKESAFQQITNVGGGGVLSPTNSGPCSSSLLRPASKNSISASASSVPLPLQPPLSNENTIPCPKSLFRSSPSLSSIPIVEFLNPNSVPFSSKPTGGGGIPNLGGTVSEQGYWPNRVWNGEYNTQGDNLRQMLSDHHHHHQRLPLPSDVVNFRSKSNFPLPRPSQQFQPSIPSSPSLMNASTGILPSHLLNYQIEPPSNQNNFSGNNSSYKPLWTNEEKMIGMKRPYPFNIETPPAPNFQLKYPPPYGVSVTPNPISRINETAAASSSSASYMDMLRYDREIPTHREEVKEKQGLNGDFLSLGPAPPHHAVGSRHNNSLRYNINSNKNINSNVSGHQHQGLFDFAPQPTRGEIGDNVAEARFSKSACTSFFSFLSPSTTAPKKQTIGQNAATEAANNCNGEVGETLDLTLRL